MKTISCAGLARVASWGSDWLLRMFMSFMTEFLDVGFTNMKKKVLHDKYISVDALFESRSCERSLIFFFLFSPTFLENASSLSRGLHSIIRDCSKKKREYSTSLPGFYSAEERTPSPRRREALGTKFGKEFIHFEN